VVHFFGGIMRLAYLAFVRSCGARAAMIGAALCVFSFAHTSPHDAEQRSTLHVDAHGDRLGTIELSRRPTIWIALALVCCTASPR